MKPSSGSVEVPLHRLRQFSPLGHPFWTEAAVTPEMVSDAISAGCSRSVPIGDAIADYDDPHIHAQRIAWFVLDGIPEDESIEIDVGIPSLGHIVHSPVQDGNHRLAAAIIRNEASVWCSISGEFAEIRRLFGRVVAQRVEASTET